MKTSHTILRPINWSKWPIDFQGKLYNNFLYPAIFAYTEIIFVNSLNSRQNYAIIIIYIYF